jgi:hypothetical protein
MTYQTHQLAWFNSRHKMLEAKTGNHDEMDSSCQGEKIMEPVVLDAT